MTTFHAYIVWQHVAGTKIFYAQTKSSTKLGRWDFATKKGLKILYTSTYFFWQRKKMKKGKNSMNCTRNA